jgi:nitroreductase
LQLRRKFQKNKWIITMLTDKPVTDVIRQRFSCRKYLEQPIDTAKREKLQKFIDALNRGPFGGQAQFYLVAADKQDSHILKDLGTYGFIQGATGYLIGTLCEGENNLEDYGFQMEQIILFATSLDLGTCWLGGTFTRSSFARKINAVDDALIPAVSSIGEISDPQQARDGFLRRQINADQRLPWEQLFFCQQFSIPLSLPEAGEYTTPLEMLRIGPSASNKQPWRVVKAGSAWHFYLQRTKGYRIGSLTRFFGVADIQRLDMGIAMCHFELTARELGLPGNWAKTEPAIAKPDELTEYTVSWVI